MECAQVTPHLPTACTSPPGKQKINFFSTATAAPHGTAERAWGAAKGWQLNGGPGTQELGLNAETISAL